MRHSRYKIHLRLCQTPCAATGGNDQTHRNRQHEKDAEVDGQVSVIGCHYRGLDGTFAVPGQDGPVGIVVSVANGINSYGPVVTSGEIAANIRLSCRWR